MALQDTLASFTSTAPATKNRVDLLLEKLFEANTQDFTTLTLALHDKQIRGADLTRALRKEYGKEIVTDTSVDAWRRRNNTEVNGL